MELPILKKDDDWPIIINKLDEESKEAQKALFDLLNADRDKVSKDEFKRLQHEAAGEILDTIQVCMGGLNKLEEEGLNLQREYKEHTKKIINRGWNIKYFYELIKRELKSKKKLKFTIKDIPPSNNKYLGNNRSRHIYADDKEMWEWLVFAAIGDKAPLKPFKRAEVTLVYYFKTRTRRDPDNYSGKFLMDGLVKAKVIKDDSFECVDLRLKGKYDKKNPRTEIIIREISSEEEE